MQRGNDRRKLPVVTGGPEPTHSETAEGSRKPEHYSSPPKAECDVVEFPIELSGLLEIRVRQWIYRSKIVDFAIMLFATEHGDMVQVARIDTKHGEVHRHRLRLGGDSGGEVIPIAAIPAHDSGDAVDREFEPALQVMMDQAESFYRSWRK